MSGTSNHHRNGGWNLEVTAAADPGENANLTKNEDDNSPAHYLQAYNLDGSNALEFSLDGGTTWIPVAANTRTDVLPSSEGWFFAQVRASAGTPHCLFILSR